MSIIQFANPSDGKRKSICNGEEARVSRITTGLYKGLVERVQEIPKTPSAGSGLAFRVLHGGGTNESVFQHSQVSFHILRFLALRVAMSIFPDNFVNAEELRIFRVDDRAYCAVYSLHVTDENGVIKRRKKLMKHFHSELSDEKADMIRKKGDEIERRLCPEMPQTAEELHEKGISIPHPEANYHLSGGKVVFFEICSIDLGRILQTLGNLEHPNKSEAIASFANFLLFYLKLEALANMSRSNNYDAATRLQIAAIRLEEVCKVVADVLGGNSSISASIFLNQLVAIADIISSVINAQGYEFKNIFSPDELSVLKAGLPCELDNEMYLLFSGMAAIMLKMPYLKERLGYGWLNF